MFAQSSCLQCRLAFQRPLLPGKQLPMLHCCPVRAVRPASGAAAVYPVHQPPSRRSSHRTNSRQDILLQFPIVLGASETETTRPPPHLCHNHAGLGSADAPEVEAQAGYTQLRNCAAHAGYYSIIHAPAIQGMGMTNQRCSGSVFKRAVICFDYSCGTLYFYQFLAHRHESNTIPVWILDADQFTHLQVMPGIRPGICMN